MVLDTSSSRIPSAFLVGAVMEFAEVNFIEKHILDEFLLLASNPVPGEISLHIGCPAVTYWGPLHRGTLVALANDVAHGKSEEDGVFTGEVRKEFEKSLRRPVCLSSSSRCGGLSSHIVLPMTETASELRERFLRAHHSSQGTSYGVGEPLLPQVHNEGFKMACEKAGYDGLGFGQYMLAGSVAGMVEHMAMFPVDTLKTRMQMLASAGGSIHKTIFRALVTILKTEGPLGLYRGIGAMGLGAGPAHAVYFSVYETAKEKLGGNAEGYHPLAHGAAGALATICSDAVFTPMDVVKQRLQVRWSPYSGLMHCIKTMLREEGLKAFYVSYRTTVVMNIPFTAVHFASYEAAKKILMELSPDKANEENLLMHIAAGGTAGALASAVTTPLDVIKTRLQLQGVGGAERFHNGSVLSAAKQIVKQEGPGALLKGIRPRILFHTPAAAICWSTYEAGKSFLMRWNESQKSD